jgi:hypothetical protein
MTNNHENIDRAGKTDGRLFPVRRGDVKPGAVLRMINVSDGSASSFSDFLVTGVTDVPNMPREHFGNVTLQRPYAFVSPTGSLLTGTETMTVEMGRLTQEGSLFRAVVNSRGDVATHLR